LKIRLALIAGLLAVSFCASVQAQSYTPFPGAAHDERTLRIQERVEELYVAGDFERALLIYQKELAPLGDKYAQYMVGYMHLNAQSLPQDKVSALAWYRIAAERGEPALEQARDELVASMTAQEITDSNRGFLDLWSSIGDTRIIMKLIRKDMDTLRDRTGTRIPASAASSPALIFRPSGEPLPPNYYRGVRVRLEARLTYLETRIEITDVAFESENEQLKVLEEQVRAELAALEVP
jgi:hypothetical protein